MRVRAGTGADPAGSGNGQTARRRRGVLAAVAVVLAGAVAAAASTWAWTGPSVAVAAGRPQSPAAARPAAAALEDSSTSCSAVAHIGDSTSVGMVSATSLPDPAQRLAAQYRDVGVRKVQIDASGGRSIVEEFAGQQNGYQVASAW